MRNAVTSPALVVQKLAQNGYRRAKSVGRRWKNHEGGHLWKARHDGSNETDIAGSLIEDGTTITFGASTDQPDSYAHHVLGSIPPELWSQIFDHATETYPAPLSIRDFSTGPLNFPTLSQDELYAFYLQSLTVKLALSTVCSAWKTLTRPFLFETIWITSAKQAHALGKLLKDEEDAGLIDARSARWWIRRIWVDGCRPGYVHEAVDWTSLRVVSNCPRLVQYRHSSWLPFPSATMHDLVYGASPLEDFPILPASWVNSFPNKHGSLPRSTRRKGEPSASRCGLASLDWQESRSGSIMSYFERHSIAFHSLSTSLEELIIRESPVSPSGSRHRTPCHLPNLHTVKVIGIALLDEFTKWELPALRNLSLWRGSSDPEPELCVLPFLEAHGSNIEVLEVLSGLYFSMILDDDNNLQPRYIELAKLCPKLETLQLPRVGLKTWPLDGTLQQPTCSPLIRKLVLSDLETGVDQGASTYLLNRLGQIKWESLPALEVVQDMSVESDRIRRKALAHRDLQEMCPHAAFWEMLVAILGDFGVTLLDWTGAPVVTRGYMDSSRRLRSCSAILKEI